MIVGEIPGYETWESWKDLVDKCVSEINDLPFEVELVQIKEKFNGFRLYYRIPSLYEVDAETDEEFDKLMNEIRTQQGIVDEIIQRYEEQIYMREKALKEAP